MHMYIYTRARTCVLCVTMTCACIYTRAHAHVHYVCDVIICKYVAHKHKRKRPTRTKKNNVTHTTELNTQYMHFKKKLSHTHTIYAKRLMHTCIIRTYLMTRLVACLCVARLWICIERERGRDGGMENKIKEYNKRETNRQANWVCYGVATTSRLLKMICLFCKRAL